MKKERELYKSELQSIVNEAMKDSYYLRAKECFFTHYFFLKNTKIYPAIFADDIDTFTERVRNISIIYLEHLK